MQNSGAATNKRVTKDKNNTETPKKLMKGSYKALPANAKAPGAALPVRSGRSSVPDSLNDGQLTFKGVKYSVLNPSFAIEWLPVLEYLAVFNHDVSYAVDNIVMLANSGHEIFFADNVKDTDAKNMLTHIKENGINWYQNSGGINSLTNDLLAQCVMHGAVSAEIIPNRNLTDIEQVERINPFNIRFFRDDQTDRYIPVQKLNGYAAISSGSNGYKELNPLTYKYVALRRIHSGPYATPPFLSAVESLGTQRSMLNNLDFIMKKLGMLGGLSVLITPPVQGKNEDAQAYMSRCEKYLNDQIPEIEAFNSEGMIAGFKGVHEFDLQSGNMNVSGAEGLFKMVETLVMAGVKQDPNMLGRQQSTSETFGRVLLAKLNVQISNYQETVAAFLSELYYMALLFAGYNPGKVEVKFKKPLTGDVLKDEQAYKAKLDNLAILQDRGIISQQDFATEAGYDEPFLAEKPEAPTPEPTGNPKAPKPDAGGSKNPTKETDPVDGKTTAPDSKKKSANARLARYDHFFAIGDTPMREALLRDLSAAIAPAGTVSFDYAVPDNCAVPSLLSSFGVFDHFKDKVMDNFVKRYAKAIYSRFQKAIAAVSGNLRPALSKLSSTASADEVVEVVFYEMYSRWPGLFSRPIERSVNEMVEQIYRRYRADKTVLGSLKKKPAPDLSLQDYRAMEYMKNIDKMYLGRFVTDPDTRLRLTNWIVKRYAKGDAPIGKNKAAIDAFRADFEEHVNFEGWKIRRIIDTSVNKMRNYAHVSYLHQSKVEKFKVVEVGDQITCEYCQHMDGKTFTVEKAFKKIGQVIDAGTSDVKSKSPFVTVFSLEDFKKMDEEALSDAGIDSPPYHGHCRGRLVAG